MPDAPKPDFPPPLAALAGARPPAPQWFRDALEIKPERTFTLVEGAKIETLAWGEIGRPGLVLLHGGGAHADWWTFLAPLFASTHRVVAFSMSGMGRSDWRASYSVETAVAEILAVAEVTGLFQAKTKPVVLGHSFGGYPTVAIAARAGGRLAGAITLDSPIVSDAIRTAQMAKRGPRSEPRPTRVYDTELEALARFRFQPGQPCENLFIADHIARHSLRRIARPDGAGDGWTWCFDPTMMRKYERTDTDHLLGAAQCPLAILWGGLSVLFRPRIAAYMRQTAPAGTAFIEIPEAHHHVMVDQPLALVAAVRALLSQW